MRAKDFNIIPSLKNERTVVFCTTTHLAAIKGDLLQLELAQIIAIVNVVDQYFEGSPLSLLIEKHSEATMLFMYGTPG